MQFLPFLDNFILVFSSYFGSFIQNLIKKEAWAWTFLQGKRGRMTQTQKKIGS